VENWPIGCIILSYKNKENYLLQLLAKYKKIALLFGLLIIFYMAQTLFAPVDKAALSRYHISAGEARSLGLTVALPYIAIWLVALTGYLRLRSYADVIDGSKDGRAFSTIAKGLLWFVLWLPLSTIVSGLFSQYYNAHPSATDNLTIINNYFNVALLLPAFWLVKTGSQHLLSVIKKPVNTVPSWAMMAYIAISALYVLLVLHDPVRFAPGQNVSVASYYEPDWVIIATLVIPRLIAWFWGLQAVINILLYRAHVKGRLYKSALNHLAFGLAGILITTVLLRFLQSLTNVLNQWSLAVILAVVYLLLIVISIGYVFIAVGAKNLQKLEEF
jgi:hypothetical protein